MVSIQTTIQTGRQYGQENGYPGASAVTATHRAGASGPADRGARGSAHQYASHGLTQNWVAGRNHNVSRRTRERPDPDRTPPARRREIERTLPDEYRWTGNGERHRPGDVRPGCPVAVHRPERHPRGVCPVARDLIVVRRQPQRVE